MVSARSWRDEAALVCAQPARRQPVRPVSRWPRKAMISPHRWLRRSPSKSRLLHGPLLSWAAAHESSPPVSVVHRVRPTHRAGRSCLRSLAFLPLIESKGAPRWSSCRPITFRTLYFMCPFVSSFVQEVNRRTTAFSTTPHAPFSGWRGAYRGRAA